MRFLGNSLGRNCPIPCFVNFLHAADFIIASELLPDLIVLLYAVLHFLTGCVRILVVEPIIAGAIGLSTTPRRTCANIGCCTNYLLARQMDRRGVYIRIVLPNMLNHVRTMAENNSFPGRSFSSFRTGL